MLSRVRKKQEKEYQRDIHQDVIAVIDHLNHQSSGFGSTGNNKEQVKSILYIIDI
tara:strand:+ start:5899 stop:6063 length:165 start_codon:yes stop_codon:yes gene_type:complete